jgi:hypothetical protein
MLIQDVGPVNVELMSAVNKERNETIIRIIHN